MGAVLKGSSDTWTTNSLSWKRRQALAALGRKKKNANGIRKLATLPRFEAPVVRPLEKLGVHRTPDLPPHFRQFPTGVLGSSVGIGSL